MQSRGCDQWESLSSTSSCYTSTSNSSSSEAACDDDFSLAVSDVCSDDGDGYASASDLYVALIVSIEPSSSSSSGSSWRERRRHSAQYHKGTATSGCTLDSSLAIERSFPPPPNTRALLFFAKKPPAKPPRRDTQLELSLVSDGISTRISSTIRILVHSPTYQ